MHPEIACFELWLGDVPSSDWGIIQSVFLSFVWEISGDLPSRCEYQRRSQQLRPKMTSKMMKIIQKDDENTETAGGDQQERWWEHWTRPKVGQISNCAISFNSSWHRSWHPESRCYWGADQHHNRVTSSWFPAGLGSKDEAEPLLEGIKEIFKRRMHGLWFDVHTYIIYPTNDTLITTNRWIMNKQTRQGCKAGKQLASIDT